ncbi:hypothetical protein N7535_006851 [Penicillium sp. DV-2018c]|nr:hypothetical protein N7461_007067 [Penicillium sp. DV-2018c]KAJ5567545.1 hypothetical protein N7535_006851 [Penicillium sp. DV-2018c]
MTLYKIGSPHCLSCNGGSIRRIARADNPNGNAGRPYYKCVGCGRFICFDDARGLSPSNPLCDCGRLRRAKIIGFTMFVRRDDVGSIVMIWMKKVLSNRFHIGRLMYMCPVVPYEA